MNCLQLALSNLQYNTYGKEWGLVYKANCQTRYGLVAFYDVIFPPSLPSAAPPPLQPSSGKKRNTSVTFISTITLAAILVILVIFIGNYFILRKVNSSGEATESSHIKERKEEEEVDRTNADRSKQVSGPSSPEFKRGFSIGIGTILRRAASVASVAAKHAYAAAASTQGSNEEMLPLKCCLMFVSLPWEHIAYDLLFKRSPPVNL